jgi:hypothetical protein
MTFRPTSVLEFRPIEVNISSCRDLEEAVSQAVEEVARCKGESRLIFRLKLTGVSLLDAELRNCNAGELHEMFRSAAEEKIPGSFLEEIVLLTRTPLPPAAAMLRTAELDAAEEEIAAEKILEAVYDEMRTVFRELPVIRKERFEELRKEGSALLAEMLTASDGGKK